MNTNVERNTKDLVAKVRAKYEKYPRIVAPVLESIHCVSQQFLAALGSEGNLDMAQMEDLIDLNQGLLETLGVSHFSIRRIISIFAQHGESSHSNTNHETKPFSLPRSPRETHRSWWRRVRLRPGPLQPGRIRGGEGEGEPGD